MQRTATPTRPKALEDLVDARLIARIEPLDLSSRRIFAGKLLGERRSKKRGQSVEFADHRPYVTGDDLRRIDWNIFGRLDRLFMKLFLEEEDLCLHLVLDASASSDCGEPGKFLFQQRAAMALGYVGLVNLNRVACSVMGGVMGGVTGGVMGDQEQASEASMPLVSALKDLRGRRRTQDLSRFLCSIEPGGAFSFRAAAERIALSRRGKGVMVVFSDFFFKDGYEQGLRLLSGRGYDVFVVQVLSPQEIEPDLTGDLKLKDVEDADLAEVTISAPLLKRYKANLKAYTEQLQQFGARRDLNVMTVRSDTPIDTLILDYFRTRGLVK
ncbi:MAG: DUF58 domain-containing protein [Planctomycetota bacterium]|nr:DUF58 domain-containing protein [Planctomycetota bacterium]